MSRDEEDAVLQWVGSLEPQGPKPLTLDEVRAQMLDAVSTHLNAVAQSRNYDSIVSLCSYTTSKNARFASEAEAGVAWRDAVWAFCHAYEADVRAGTKPVPSRQELIDALPVMRWPDEV